MKAMLGITLPYPSKTLIVVLNGEIDEIPELIEAIGQLLMKSILIRKLGIIVNRIIFTRMF